MTHIGGKKETQTSFLSIYFCCSVFKTHNMTTKYTVNTAKWINQVKLDSLENNAIGNERR